MLLLTDLHSYNPARHQSAPARLPGSMYPSGFCSMLHQRMMRAQCHKLDMLPRSNSADALSLHGQEGRGYQPALTHLPRSMYPSGFCSARSFQPKQRSREPNQSRVWSVLEMVGTGLVLMRIRTASPRCSSCLQVTLPSRQEHRLASRPGVPCWVGHGPLHGHRVHSRQASDIPSH